MSIVLFDAEVSGFIISIHDRQMTIPFLYRQDRCLVRDRYVFFVLKGMLWNCGSILQSSRLGGHD